MKINLKGILRMLTGVFFIISAVSKLSSMESFELYIFSFELFSFDLCSYAARLVVAAELWLGAGLIFRFCNRSVKLLTLLSLVFFSGFLGWRMLAGDTESCHCMGELVDMNPLQSLIKNAVLFIILGYVWNEKPLREMRSRFLRYIYAHQKMMSALLAVVSLAVVFAVTPPAVVLRLGHSSHDLVQEEFSPVCDSLGLSQGRQMVCFYSATCPHCRHCAAKVEGIVSRNGIPENRITALFMQTSAEQDAVVEQFFEENAGGHVLPYRYFHPLHFLRLSNGAIPIVVLLEDGKIWKEYDYISLDEAEISDFFRE